MSDDLRSLWAQIERSPLARRRIGMFFVVSVAHALGAEAARDAELIRELPLRVAIRGDKLDLTLAGRSIGTYPLDSLFVG